MICPNEIENIGHNLSFLRQRGIGVAIKYIKRKIRLYIKWSFNKKKQKYKCINCLTNLFHLNHSKYYHTKFKQNIQQINLMISHISMNPYGNTKI